MRLGHRRIRRRHFQRCLSSVVVAGPEGPHGGQKHVVAGVGHVQVVALDRGVDPDAGSLVARVGQGRQAPGRGGIQRTHAATAALRRLLPPNSEAHVVTVATLTDRCVKSLQLPGRPMAAAHRQVARPDDPVSALWHDVTVLREHRGDGHLIAVATAGLVWPEPQLLITDRLDPAQQAHRGWTDEQWTTAASRIHHHDVAAIDDATDRLAAPAYDILTPQELAPSPPHYNPSRPPPPRRCPTPTR